jgi:hypothetical protein
VSGVTDEQRAEWREQAAPNPQARRGYRERDAKILALLDALDEAEQRLAAARDLLPKECWMTHLINIRCTEMIGGTFPDGTAWTADMCCLPCRLRAALDLAATSERRADPVTGPMPWPEDGCDHTRMTCEEAGCPNASRPAATPERGL